MPAGPPPTTTTFLGLAAGGETLVVRPPAQRGVDLATDPVVLHHAGLAGDARGAGTDVVLSALVGLVGIVRVGEQPPADGHGIALAFGDELLAQRSIEFAHGDDRDGDHLLDSRRQVDVHPLLEVDGGELLDDGLGRLGVGELLGDGDAAVGRVAIGHDVEVVGPGRFKPLGELLALRGGGALGDPVLGPVQLDGQQVVVTDPLPAGLEDFQGEAAAVLQAAGAVLVVSPVPHAREEGVDEVVVVAVEFDAVEAGLLDPFGRVRVLDDDVLDLRDGQRPQRPVAKPVEEDLLGLGVQIRRSDRDETLRKVPRVRGEHGVGAQVVDLHDDRAVVLVGGLGQRGHTRQHRVVVHVDAAVAAALRRIDHALLVMIPPIPPLASAS